MEKGTTHYSNADIGISLTVNIGELAPGSLLKGKVVFITGAAKGIGYAIAKACINQGAKVIITGRKQDELEAASAALGENCAAICFDVCDMERYQVVFDRATEYFGNIDCIVHNAGISLHEGHFMNVTEETWDAQFATNLKAPYFMTQTWLRYYSERNMKSGRIVMLASDTSGMGSSIPYGLAKAGIASLTRGLAKHIIAQGVRINAVAPGTTKTAMTDDFTHGEICRATTEGKRVLFPEEIAQSCVFLLSDLSACISGQVIGCTEANVCFDNTSDAFAFEYETNP